ncbi:hypothetical protein BDZ91DRAFT_328292 [Kalaharituber pfeilii]|nr:hypothetical protein BDZ91DRAFT_328292 [Kalaharituber pfeilii]
MLVKVPLAALSLSHLHALTCGGGRRALGLCTTGSCREGMKKQDKKKAEVLFENLYEPYKEKERKERLSYYRLHGNMYSLPAFRDAGGGQVIGRASSL